MKTFQIAKRDISINKFGILIFCALLSLFFLWFSTVYDPDLFADLEEFYQNFPDAIKSLVGGTLSISDYNSFMNVYLFSFAWMWMGLYFILKASQDIPTEIEEKTIDITLSKPISRWEFVLGKLLRHIIVLLFLMGLVMLAVFSAPFIFPNTNPSNVNFGALSIAFILLTLHLISLIVTGFIFSTIFNRKKALALGFGLLIFFYAVGQFYGLFPEFMRDIKYVSIFYYYDTYDLLVNASIEGFFINVLVLSIYSIALIIASVLIFQKRNIPV
ncbi:MAG: ABC transporter permease subunit [Candidatus Lokiarchaeota archaeon]|nr:ABC transporter permease subunit [Candidatus Lokiarchaeota archaeon]